MSYHMVKHCLICDGEQAGTTSTNHPHTMSDICITCKRTLASYVAENYSGVPILDGQTVFNW